jgi:hypothetical protein
MSATPQEPDPPEVALVVRAGIVILGRIVEHRALWPDDLPRLAAYTRALERLERHLDGPGA